MQIPVANVQVVDVQVAEVQVPDVEVTERRQTDVSHMLLIRTTTQPYIVQPETLNEHGFCKRPHTNHPHRCVARMHCVFLLLKTLSGTFIEQQIFICIES